MTWNVNYVKSLLFVSGIVVTPDSLLLAFRSRVGRSRQEIQDNDHLDPLTLGAEKRYQVLWEFKYFNVLYTLSEMKYKITYHQKSGHKVASRLYNSGPRGCRAAPRGSQEEMLHVQVAIQTSAEESQRDKTLFKEQ